MLNLLTRLFGSRNDRIVRGYETTVRKAAAFENALQALSDEALAAPRPTNSASASPTGETLNDLAPEAFAVVREAARRTLKMRHFDVQLIGGLTLQRGPHRRDAHRRRQDADVDAGRVPQRAAPAKACTSSPSTSTWRSATPTGWDRSTGSSGSPSVSSEPAGLGREARGLRLRHHLRHQQRIRLRLPARQPRLQSRGPRAAQAGVRHRRRSRLDPHRRSAHAADHFRPGRREHRAVPQDRQAGAAPQEAGNRGGPRRLLGRREAASRRT